MNPPSPEGQPPVPGYDQAALLGSLGLKELRDVQAALTPSQDPSSWRETVKAARAQIEADLAALAEETVQPVTPEYVPYDAEKGPYHYLNLVRQENLGHASFSGDELTIFRYSHPAEIALYLELAHGYVQRNAARISGYFESSVKFLKDSFAANMRWLVMPPRIRAEDEHRGRRVQAWNEALPGVLSVTPRFLRRTSYDKNVSLTDIANARQAVAAQPATMSLPDFFQMEESQQQEVVEAIGEQWLELRDVLQSNAPRLLKVPLYRTTHPLAYWDASVLKQALAEVPGKEIGLKICRAFLSNPREFKTSLTALAAEQAYTVKLAQSGTSDPGRTLAANLEDQGPERAAVTENMEAITNLLTHRLVRPEVLDLMPGAEVPLSNPGELVPALEADELIDLHFQLLGRALNEAHPVKNPRGVVFERWEKHPLGKLLRGTHEGNLRNIRLSRLPLTEEDLQSFFGEHYDPTKVQPSTVARLLLTAELKSSGKPYPPTAAVSLFLVSRKYTSKPDAIYKSGRKLSANGLALSRSLRNESAAVARVMEGYYREVSFRAGIPGSGPGKR